MSLNRTLCLLHWGWPGTRQGDKVQPNRPLSESRQGELRDSRTRFLGRAFVAVAVLCLTTNLLMGSDPPPEAAADTVPAPQHAEAAERPAVDQVARWTVVTQQNPEDASAWVHLGDALMQQSRQASAGDYYDQAEAAFRRALSLDSKNTHAMVGMSWVCNSRHQFDEGGQWAHQAIALASDSQDAFAMLGDAAVELGDYDQAFEHYQRCLDLGPNLSSYSRAAHLMFLTGDPRKAKWLMQKAIDAGGPYPENVAWCRAQLALMSFHTGAVVPAEKQLEQALKQSPDNRHLLAAMAKIKMAGQEYEAAMDFCQRALAIVPDHDVLVTLGDLYALLGKEEQAQQQYDQVVAFHKGHHHGDHHHEHGHPSDHGNAQLARFYADHDRDLDEALREAQKAYENYKNVFITDTLAWCYYKNEMLQEAKSTIHQALRWETPDANILFHAGMIYARLEDRSTAQKYLYQALSLNPHFHPFHAPLAAETLRQLAAP